VHFSVLQNFYRVRGGDDSRVCTIVGATKGFRRCRISPTILNLIIVLHIRKTRVSKTMAVITLSDGYVFNEDDPSAERRKALMGETNDNMVVSSFFGIEKYYSAADTCFQAFQAALDRDDHDSTFVYGKRYCNFIVNQMKHHPYYKQPRYAKLKKKHIDQVEAIMDQLEFIKSIMDDQEREKYKQRVEWIRREEARKAKERKKMEEKRKAEDARQLQELMKRAEQTRVSKLSSPQDASTNGDVGLSAQKKLEMLMKQASPGQAKEGKRKSSTRFRLSDSEEDEAEDEPSISVGEPLPPPMPPPSSSQPSTSSGSSISNDSVQPPPPPAYNFAINKHRPNPFLKHNMNGSNGGMLPCVAPPPVSEWGDARPPSYNALPDPPSRRYPHLNQQQQQNKYYNQQLQPTTTPKKQPKMTMRQVKEKARTLYNNCIQEGRIEIRPIDTYQGRFGRSTNGCTVISPLIVAHHLKTGIGGMVNDAEIKMVIDDQCVPLLREIRGKLGLEDGSLIIPSDVNDHLVDKQILKQEYFVGVAGGNIVGREHKEEFLKLFREKPKVGAALFFREHVISIIKIPIGNGGAWYDLVDSMPGMTDNRGHPCASRTRAKDEAAFQILLTWYATKKFTDGNCSYIDRNEWDDGMADLDPRVFQAFVWGRDD